MAGKKKKMVSDDDIEVVDVKGPEYVEFRVSKNGKTVWVNVDGVCAFRASNAKQIEIDDGRRVPKMREQDAFLNQDPILRRAIEDN